MGRSHRRTGSIDARPKTHGAAFGLTAHAIEQFRDRVAPGLTLGAARMEAIVLSRSAVHRGDHTGEGAEIWIATDGAPVRFVVRNSGGRRVCVTVLGPDDRDDGPEVAA